MTQHHTSARTLKPVSMLALACVLISNAAFAEKNPNIIEACAQYRRVASAPQTEYVLKYHEYSARDDSVISARFECTLYRGAGPTYYKSQEDRAQDQNPLVIAGMFAMPLEEFYNSKDSFQNYKKFFKMCGLSAQDTGIGILYMTTNEFDPVAASYALQKSEWFDLIMPAMFMNENSVDEYCTKICGSVEECKALG